MKKIIITTIFAILLIPAMAQKGEKKEKSYAEIKFEKTHHNFGTFAADTAILDCEFKFKNIGNADLYIHQSFVSCGCTATRIPENAIKPGETDTITVTYDGRRKSPGKMRRSITIHNNSQEEMIKLYVIGKMLPHKEQEVEEVKIEE